MSDKFDNSQEYIYQFIQPYTAAIYEEVKYNNSRIGGVIYPGAFITLYEQIPPPGFAVRDGSVITEASINAPLLYAELQLPNNTWKCITEEEWLLLSEANPWKGIGGVPFFVLDIDNDTIRLPDTRGMHEECMYDSNPVGTVHSDMIRNITGEAYWVGEFGSWADGCFYTIGNMNYTGHQGGDGDNTQIGLDASLIVPTGPVNRPKSYCSLHCVYIGLT